MSNQNFSITFREEKEEQIASVFLLEDLIKEYNHKIASTSLHTQKKKVLLSLRPIEKRSSHQTSSNYPIIRPMTKEEINSMKSMELKRNDWNLFKNILQNQIGQKGLVSNIPTIVQGVSIAELVNELGLKGKVYYKTENGKTYVILKGLAGKRTFLKGTTYLNTNPQIVQFGLAKLTLKSAAKSGFKTSILIYGAVKAVEATGMMLQDGELKTSFFSEVVTDIPKIALTSAVAAAAGVTVAAAGIPIAVGVGIVLVVGFLASVALDYFDQKTGLTEKFNNAADKMRKDLEEHMKSNPTSQQRFKDWDPTKGLVFGGPLARHQQALMKRNYFVYTA